MRRANLARRPRLVLAVLVLVAALTGIGGCSVGEVPELRIMVPNAPGSGYDITARIGTQVPEGSAADRLMRDLGYEVRWTA